MSQVRTIEVDGSCVLLFDSENRPTAAITFPVRLDLHSFDMLRESIQGLTCEQMPLLLEGPVVLHLLSGDMVEVKSGT